MSQELGNQRRHELVFSGADLSIGTVPPATVLRGNFSNKGYTVNDDSVISVPLPLGWVYGSTIVVWADWMINEPLAPGNKNVKFQLIYEGLLPGSGVAVGAGPVGATVDTGDILIPAVALSVVSTQLAVISDTDLAESMILGMRFKRIVAAGGAPAQEPEITALHVLMAVQTLNYKV